MSLARAALVAATALALAAPAAARPKPKPVQKCNGLAVLCARTFDQVVLPATHNSMSNAADGFPVPNQQVGIPAQLQAGVRGFLIDSYLVGDQVYLCHVTCDPAKTPFAQTLAAMAAFLKKHPNEVLLLDIEDYVAPATMSAAIQASPLAHYVYRGPTGPWPTLRTMIKRHQQVVVLAEHDNVGGAPWYHLDYAGIVQETPYDWDTEAQLEDPAQLAASCAPNRGGTTGSLFLMNHWSPPFGANEPEAARVNAKAVILARARACQQARGKLPTIVAVDLFQSGDLFGAVRELNLSAKSQPVS